MRCRLVAVGAFLAVAPIAVAYTDRAAAQSAAPTIVPCQRSPGILAFDPWYSLQEEVFFAALIFTLLILILSFVGTRVRINDPMGPVQWDIKDSWLSTLTAAGGILGTTLAASGIFPTDYHTRLICRPGYASLSAFFGILPIVATLLYTATLFAPSKNAQLRFPKNLMDLMRRVLGSLGTGDVGRVGFFGIATGITILGVVGQLLTFSLLTDEMVLENALPPLIAMIFWGFIAVTVLLVPVFANRMIRRSLGAVRTVRQLIDDWRNAVARAPADALAAHLDPVQTAAHLAQVARAVPQRPQMPSWTLL